MLAELAFFYEIKKDLVRVEQELYKALDTPHAILAESSAHLLAGGGKRLRPALTLLAGRCCGGEAEHLVPLAVALELIHMATLVHDDVIDNSYLRRNLPTVKARWGDDVSLFSGDYLFAKSLLLVSTYSDQRIAGGLAWVSVRMCRGEILQMFSAYDLRQSLRDYIYRIRCKTALLLAASCRLGALACGASTLWERALASYGYNLGMAFQVTDDILDVVAGEEELGKPVGTDLKEGIYTLPVLLALQHQSLGERLRGLLAACPQEQDAIREALDLIREAGGDQKAARVAGRYLEKAKKELDKLPVGKPRQALLEAAEFIKSRRF